LFSEPTIDNVSVTVLKNEFFSATVELEPNEALRYSSRPLKKMLPRLNESEMDRKNEFFSARPDAEPRDPPRFFASALTWELARLREPLNDRNSVFLSVKLEPEPTESLKLLVKPLM
jgi:hypothetical protein